MAQDIARQMHYPSYAFVNSPQVQQEAADAGLITVGLLNIAFHWDHPVAGVLLYDGVGELELASTFDTYAATYTTKLLSVSKSQQLITTKHGLQLVPRWDFNDVPAMDRLIVPGSKARWLAAAAIDAWEQDANAAAVSLLHADHPDSFAFDAPLHDLAQQENMPTAVLNAKHLEYRPGTAQSEGSRWPVWLTLRPLLAEMAGLALTLAVSKRVQRQPSKEAGRTGGAPVQVGA